MLRCEYDGFVSVMGSTTRIICFRSGSFLACSLYTIVIGSDMAELVVEYQVRC